MAGLSIEISDDLENAWPPTPPDSPTITTSDHDGDEHLVAAEGPKYSRLVRVYTLVLGTTSVQLLIKIVPTPNEPNHHTISLSLKAGGIHRSICTPVTLNFTFDPHDLVFTPFLFPPKSSLPKRSLYSLRVWARHDHVDHRIFSEDALWIGSDLDFDSITDANFARLLHTMHDLQCYESQVGQATVRLVVRWTWLKDSLFSFSLEYESGGLGRLLFKDQVLRLDFPPQQINFYIYTIPLSSKPPGASHRLRVWLKSPWIPTTEDDLYASYIYQRLWSTDNFRLGLDLDFRLIDRRVIIGELITRPSGLRLKTT